MYKFDDKRPISWSNISKFEFNKEEWFDKYVLGKKEPPNRAMVFGKEFGLSCENRKPMAPVRLLSEVEYELKTLFSGIHLIGYIDTYEPHLALGEFKTTKTLWTQDKVDNHGQIDMYLLQLYIMHKVRPEDIDCYLQCILTEEDEDFNVSLKKPIEVHTFKTKRTMADILRFGVRIKKNVEEMKKYIEKRNKDELVTGGLR